MDYVFKKPEKLTFDKFLNDFIPKYGELAKGTENFQSIEVWAGPYCVPPNSPYNPATCWPIA